MLKPDDLSKINAKMDHLDKLSMEIYGSYAASSGIYRALLASLACGIIDSDNVVIGLDYHITRYVQQLAEKK